MADIPALLSMGGPVHLVLVKTDSSGDTTLLSSQFFEWRPLLTSRQGNMKTSLEMLGTGCFFCLHYMLYETLPLGERKKLMSIWGVFCLRIR